MKSQVDTHALLRTARVRYTKHRARIIETLAREKHPLCVEEIHALLKTEMNIVTMYRTLELLAKKGVLHQTSFNSGKAYFEFQSTHHHHVTCTQCGRREETDVCVAHPPQTNFAHIHGHMLEFFGTCAQCINRDTMRA